MTSFPRRTGKKATRVDAGPSLAGAEASGQDSATNVAKRKRAPSPSSVSNTTYVNTEQSAVGSSKKSKVLPQESVDASAETLTLRRGRTVMRGVAASGPAPQSLTDNVSDNAPASGPSQHAASEDNSSSIDPLILAYIEPEAQADRPLSPLSDLDNNSEQVPDVKPSKNAELVPPDFRIPPEFIDTDLAKRGYYRNVPSLPPPFRPMRSPFYREEERVRWMTYRNVTAKLPDEAAPHLLQALQFRRHKWAFNLARARLDDTAVTEDRLRDSETGNVALCISFGIVSHCSLVGGAGRSSSANYPKYITIRPFGFEFYREQTYLGLKFGHDEFNGPLYLTSFKLSTASDLASSVSTGCTIDTRPSLYDGVLLRTGATLPIYRGPLPSQASVDVYDGRHDSETPFNFSAEELDAVRTWPLLRDVRGVLADPTYDSVVAVAYTVRKGGNQTPTLVPELQFVIALHINDTA